MDGIKEAVSPCLLKDLASNRMGWETTIGMIVHAVGPCLNLVYNRNTINESSIQTVSLL